VRDERSETQRGLRLWIVEKSLQLPSLLDICCFSCVLICCPFSPPDPLLTHSPDDPMAAWESTVLEGRRSRVESGEGPSEGT
jgi:hypothetical protein